MASSSRRAIHVTYMRCQSIDVSNREKADGSPDGTIASPLSSLPSAGPSSSNHADTEPSATTAADATAQTSPLRPRSARPTPLRKRTICLSSPFAPGKRASDSNAHPRRRHAYVLFSRASSVDKVRARLGRPIDFYGSALFPELIPPVTVGGPTNKALQERLHPRKDPLHPAGVRPKDTLFIRRLEGADSEELRGHIEASCRDLVSLTRQLRFSDVKAASRARTVLKDYFRRSSTTAWVDFKTDEGDLPVVLRAQQRNRAEQLRRLQHALLDPARDDKESVQAAIEVAKQKLEETKEKLAHVEELAAKSE
ncbi:hypothetical protein FB107DRAFT_292911 [Schizophyllum commune]